ncbi:MAG TPA: hypothetical protein VD965_11925 [Burkholderiales bacterium]|nr:hypothetical protein [Burkholderiales bacterium]
MCAPHPLASLLLAEERNELRVFLATGEANGARHALLIFCRGAAGERDACRGAAEAGWTGLSIERCGRLLARPAEPVLAAAFDEALRDGSSVVAHRRREGRGVRGRSPNS